MSEEVTRELQSIIAQTQCSPELDAWVEGLSDQGSAGLVTDADMLIARFGEMMIELDNTGRCVLTPNDKGDLQDARTALAMRKAIPATDALVTDAMIEAGMSVIGKTYVTANRDRQVVADIYTAMRNAAPDGDITLGLVEEAAVSVLNDLYNEQQMMFYTERDVAQAIKEQVRLAAIGQQM